MSAPAPPASVVGRHSSRFTSAPRRVPDALIPDGPLLGNGDLGVCVSVDRRRLRFWIAKADFWRSEPRYPRGGPRPFGWVDVELPDEVGDDLLLEVCLADAELRARLGTRAGLVDVTAWVAATRNALVIELGGPVADRCQVTIEARTGGGATTAHGTADGVSWATRSFAGAELDWPATMTGELADVRDGVEATTFVATFGCDHGVPEPPAGEVTSTLRADLDAAGVEAVRREHRSWWSGYWSISEVELGDDLVERHYYGAQYLLACSSRNCEFPPGLYGVWVTSDAPEWAGDYHLNYNYQAAWWGAFSSNHLELCDPYDAPILAYRERGRRYARELLDCDGVYYDVGIGPRGYCSSLEPDGPAFLGQKSNATFAALNMVVRYRFTRDARYGTMVLPFLADVVAFWLDYTVTEDGRIVVPDDSLNESGPWDGDDYRERADVNNTLTLGLVRSVLDGAIEITEDLGDPVDERWRRLRHDLSAFPTDDIDGRTRILGSERGLSAGPVGPGNVRLLVQSILYPAVSLDAADRALVGVLRAELAALPRDHWVDATNGFDSVFPGAARAGLPAEDLLDRLHAKLTAHGGANLWIYQAGGGIETIGGIEGAVNEMLLQSWDGRVRVFPCWPPARPARFRGLRAECGVLVSAAQSGGRVDRVELHALRDVRLVVANPWHGVTEATLGDGDGPPQLVPSAQTDIELQLAAGSTIDLSPSTDSARTHERPAPDGT